MIINDHLEAVGIIGNHWESLGIIGGGGVVGAHGGAGAVALGPPAGDGGRRGHPVAVTGPVTAGAGAGGSAVAGGHAAANAAEDVAAEAAGDTASWGAIARRGSQSRAIGACRAKIF